MSAALERFARCVGREDFGLADACLMIAEDVYPDVDIPAGLAQLDAIAATIRSRLPVDAFPEQKLAALNHCLFTELKFAGNADDYDDPRNSYLNEVLARRLGIPITLSILYLEVGRRLGLPLQGVAFPGHFLVKLRVSRGELILDPFNRGATLSLGELRRRVLSTLPAGVDEDLDISPLLQATPPRFIIARVLRNLKEIYLRANRLDRALEVMHRLLAMLPGSAEELRDRGLIHARMECFGPAVEDLQGYLRRKPDADDADAIGRELGSLRAAAARIS